MTRNEIFSKLWELYSEQNPYVLKVHKSFTNYGEQVINDHVAFRTFNDPRMDIDVLERLFIYAGYVKKGDYHFEEKKLIGTPFPVNARISLSEVTSRQSKSLQTCGLSLWMEQRPFSRYWQPSTPINMCGTPKYSASSGSNAMTS